jgi:signal transduction histidine kinase
VLTGLELDVTWLAKRLTKKQNELLEKTEGMRQLIDATVQQVRRISTGLRPEILDEMGLVAAIGWQAGEFQRRVGIRCRLRLPEDQISLDKERSTAVFRIFQEVLTNVARHARATSVHVDLAISEDNLTLQVADDGIGISADQVRSHDSLGLLGMRERAQLLGGDVSIHGAPSRGTTVSVSLPTSRPRA